MSGKGKAAANAPSKCPVTGCKMKLDAANLATCAKCGLKVCRLHIYPSDHKCVPAGAAKPASSAATAPAASKLEVISSSGASSASASTAAKSKPIEVLSSGNSNAAAKGTKTSSDGNAKVSSSPSKSPKSPGLPNLSPSDLVKEMSSVTTQILVDDLLESLFDSTSPSPADIKTSEITKKIESARCKVFDALDLVAMPENSSVESVALTNKALNFARAAMTSIGPHSELLLNIFKEYLTKNSSPSDRDVRNITPRWSTIITLFGCLRARTASYSTPYHVDVKTLVEWSISFPSLRGRYCSGRAAAEILLWNRRANPQPKDVPEIQQLAKWLWDKALVSCESDKCNPLSETDPVNSVCHSLAALVRGIGVSSLDEIPVIRDALAVSLEASSSGNKKTSSQKSIPAVMFLAHTLSVELKRLFEPHAIHYKVLDLSIQSYCKGSNTLKSTAEVSAISLLAHVYGPRGMAEILPQLEAYLNDVNWKVKEISLKLLNVLAQRAATAAQAQLILALDPSATSVHSNKFVHESLFSVLPTTLPLVMSCVMDSKKEVEGAASMLLDSLAAIVTNPETIKLMPFLLKALKNPSSTDKFLDELMDLTIVNSLDAQSLAMIMPVVIRGLREGGTDQKKKAAIATGNVCTIVKRVSDILVYYPIIKPELTKLTDHSSPDVRAAATKAKLSLEKAVSSFMKEGDDSALIAAASAKSENGMGSPLHFPNQEVQKVIMPESSTTVDDMASLSLDVASMQVSSSSSGSKPLNAEKVLRNYVVEAMNWLANEELKEKNIGRLTLERIERDIENTVGMLLLELFGTKGANLPQSPRLSGYRSPMLTPGSPSFSSSNATVSQKLANILFMYIRRARSKSFDEYQAAHDTILFELNDIILAFASRVLLQRTTLKMKIGHRYALIGQNGVGKTTLLRRLAVRDIGGFPKSVITYHVEHEILSEDKHLTVLAFMLHGESAEQLSGGITGTPDEARCVHVLKEVGFSEDVMRNSPVGSLSGGWRMRLAIARSMVHKADLLLFDEPTNHLDRESNLWLSDYICSLENTICIVSHDYDFLKRVATDVVLIRDQKLDYFEGTFQEFQDVHPEIVDALPKPAKHIEYGASTEAGANDGQATTAEQQMERMLQLSETNAQEEQQINASASSSSSFELLMGPQAEEVMRERGILPMKFPDPGKLEGITSRGKPVLKLTDIIFGYPVDKEGGERRVILNGVSCHLSLNSRICIVGKNGAGKSTLLKLLIGELDLDEAAGDAGKIWKHQNLRTSYISQHSLHHLESEIESTPVQYIQRRFYEGRDKEMSKMMTLSLTDEEKAMCERRGEICGILSRVVRGKSLCYEVDINGRSKNRARSTGRPGEGAEVKDYRTLEELEFLKKPHIIKLVRMFDEKLKAEASGMDIRPIT